MHNKILNYLIYYGLFIGWFFIFFTGIGHYTNIPQENVNDMLVFISIVCLIISFYFEKKLVRKGYNPKTLLTPHGLFFIISVIWYAVYKFF